MNGNLERWKAMPLALALLLLSPQQEAQAVCNEKKRCRGYTTGCDTDCRSCPNQSDYGRNSLFK